MSQPYSSREDIKKDVFQDSIQLALEWIAANRQTFFSIVGTAAVALGILFFVLTNFRNLRKQAWERYSAGQNWAYANNPDNAVNLFNEVVNNFSRTPAAAYSLLAKGDVLYQQRKYAEAADAYKQCIEHKPPKLILPFALVGLASSQEDSNDLPAAIGTYKRFIAEYPDHYLAPKAYESLGRIYELSMNPDAAKETYEKIITMFPATLWSEKARVRYQSISPQPFQTPTSSGLESSPVTNPSGR